MNQTEKEKIFEEANRALANGDEALYDKLLEKIPSSPDFVMGMKKIFGADVVLNAGLNLTEVEERYGADWHK